MEERPHYEEEDQAAAGAPELPALPPERYDLRILSSLRRIVRSIDSHSSKLATDHGVTVPQLLCMLKVQERGAMTLKQLAREVHVNSSTLVGIVDRLEKSGLFARVRSVSDRREVSISLTEKGQSLVEQSPSPLQENLVLAIGRLPEEERATIALALERICSCIDSEQVPVAPPPQPSFDAPILYSSRDLAETKDQPPRVDR